MKTKHEFLIEYLEEHIDVIESLQMPDYIRRSIKICKERKFDDLWYFINESYTMRENFSHCLMQFGHWYSTALWFEYLNDRCDLEYGRYRVYELRKQNAGMAELG